MTILHVREFDEDSTDTASCCSVNIYSGTETDDDELDGDARIISTIQRQIEMENNILYEKARTSLMICDLLKRASLCKLTHRDKQSRDVSTQTEEVTICAVVDNTENRRPAAPVNGASGTSHQNLMLSTADKLALTKFKKLTIEGGDKHFDVENSRRTFHSCRQNGQYGTTRDFVKSISSIVDKMSLLEKEITVPASPVQDDLESRVRRNTQDLRHLRKIVAKVTNENNEADIRKISDQVEQMLLTSEAGLAPLRPAWPQSVPMRAALMQEIRVSSGSKNLKPLVNDGTNSKAILRLHEIQDTLRKAIADHRIALTRTEVDDDFNDFDWSP